MLISIVRRLIALRRSSPALRQGAYRPVAATGDALGYLREADGQRLLVALNLGAGEGTLDMPVGMAGQVVLGTAGEREGEAVCSSLRLRANEGVIVEIAR